MIDPKIEGAKRQNYDDQEKKQKKSMEERGILGSVRLASIL